MADAKISALTAAVSVAGTDIVPSVQTTGIGPVKTTLTQITDYALANAAAGAVATPSIARSGDTNTGIWFPGADTIAISTSGTEALRVNLTNNLSIGSTASAAKLYVVQTGAASTCTYFIGVGGAKLLIDYIGSGMNYFDGGITFRNTASGTIMTLDNTNGNLNVCAGTATPAGGSTTARMLFGTTAGFGIYYGSGAPTVSAAKGSLYLRSDGTTTNDRMYVNTNGSTTWTNVTTGA